MPRESFSAECSSALPASVAFPPRKPLPVPKHKRPQLPQAELPPARPYAWEETSSLLEVPEAPGRIPRGLSFLESCPVHMLEEGLSPRPHASLSPPKRFSSSFVTIAVSLANAPKDLGGQGFKTWPWKQADVTTRKFPEVEGKGVALGVCPMAFSCWAPFPGGPALQDGS